MPASSKNESWLVDAGDEVIRLRSEEGAVTLSARDRLIYCLWVADYGMRNAGDLSQAHILHPRWQQEAVATARELSLRFTHWSFALPRWALQGLYFRLFEHICNEVRNA